MALSRRMSDPIRAVVLAAALIAGWLLFRELVTLFVVALITVIVAIPLDTAATALGLFVAVPIISAVLIVARAVWVDPMRRAEAGSDQGSSSDATADGRPLEHTLRVPA
jgi:hypothetical protein